MPRSFALRACLFTIALISVVVFLLIGLFASASSPVAALALPRSKPTATGTPPVPTG
jgi:hypothetical protein